MAATQGTPGLVSRREDYGFQTDARELRAFFTAYESDVRFTSTFSAMLAAAAGVAVGSGPPTGWDPYADVIDLISRGTRVYRTLRRMDAAGHDAHVRVLYRLHGPRNGSTERPEWGELAPLAVVTAAAEDARADFVFTESSRREERVGPRVAHDHRRRCAEIATLFWQEVGVIARSDAKAKRARTLASRAHAERRSIAGRQLLKQLLDGYGYDGTLRARLGAITSTDRELTVEDAIRAKLDARKRSPGDREAFAAWSAERKTFVAQVLAEAEAMRREAHAAYRSAKVDVEDAPCRNAGFDVPRTWRPATVSYSVTGASP